MRLRSPQGELALRLLRTVPSQGANEPDLQVRVTAKIAAFAATGTSVWLDWADVSAFVQELESLVRDCKGTATIAAMSPDEFHLSVANVDSLGHFAVKFGIASMVHSRGGIFDCGLSGGFELELSQLEELLSWFKNPSAFDDDA